MMLQPYDPFGDQQMQPSISRHAEQPLAGGPADAAFDDLPLLPEGEAGAAGQALRLEADDGESESLPEDADEDADEEAAAVGGDSAKSRAKRLGRPDGELSPVTIVQPEKPPRVVAVGDGSFVPASFAAKLCPLLEPLTTPVLDVASSGLALTTPLAALPPMLRATSAPPLSQVGSATTVVSAAPAASVGIASTLLADAGVDVSLSATIPLSAPLAASITKDRIIAAMEALESFATRAAEAVAHVEAAAPQLRTSAADLRAAFDKQQLAAAETKQRQAAAAAIAAAAAAASAASAAEAAQSAASTSSSRRVPIPVFWADELLLKSSELPCRSALARLLSGACESEVAAVGHLLSLLCSWSALPLWATQLVDASSSAATERALDRTGAAGTPSSPSARPEVIGDAVLSGRIWRLLASLWSGALGHPLHVVLAPATPPSDAATSRLGGVAIRFHRTLPAQLRAELNDPTIAVALKQSTRIVGSDGAAVAPYYYLQGLPDAYPSSAIVLAFSTPQARARGTGAVQLYATIAATEAELALCATIDGNHSVLCPALRRKKSEAVTLSASSVTATIPTVILFTQSLLAHRNEWVRASASRRDVLLGNRARSWMGQAEQARLLSADAATPNQSSAREVVAWAAGLQQDGDDFVVPLPVAARVGKPAARVRETLVAAGGAPARLMRHAVADALRARVAAGHLSTSPSQDGAAMDWDTTSDGFGDGQLSRDARTRDSNQLDLSSFLSSARGGGAVENLTSVTASGPGLRETALIAWKAPASSDCVSHFVAADDTAVLLDYLVTSQSRQEGVGVSSHSTSLRLATERLIHLHIRSHVEGVLLFRRASLRSQQKLAATAFVTAYRDWKSKRLRQARSRRLRIRHSHARVAADFAGGGGTGGLQPTLPVAAAAAVVTPKFATERSGGRRAAALVAAVAIASSGEGAAKSTGSAGTLPSPPPPALPAGRTGPALQKHYSSPHQIRLDSLTDPTHDLASDTGDDEALTRFGGGRDVVRSELELQQRLLEMAERERRLEFRLCSLCAVPDRIAEPRTRAFWSRVHYSAVNRLTTDGAPPLCSGLPAGIPCGAARPSMLQIARALSSVAAMDTAGSGVPVRNAPLLLGSADDAAAMVALSLLATRSLADRFPVPPPHAPPPTSRLVSSNFERTMADAFDPHSGDNVPPPRRRLWMGGCNCAVAVEVERRLINPWSDAEKLIFMDKFMQARDKSAAGCARSACAPCIVCLSLAVSQGLPEDRVLSAQQVRRGVRRVLLRHQARRGVQTPTQGDQHSAAQTWSPEPVAAGLWRGSRRGRPTPPRCRAGLLFRWPHHQCDRA